tara:strand:+ start:594 stop:1112 length:519 start_codon:yes stop_codon:yes gene_type:complete
MKKNFLLTVLILFFLVVFTVFYKGLQNPNIYTPAKNLKKTIPSFSVYKFDNDTIINSEQIFNGESFYLMNIWASWCVPCREEHPYLMQLKTQDNLIIVGLNYKDKKSSAKNFLKKLNNPYDILLSDQDGTVSIEWGAYGVPETFLIRKNKIIKKIIGPMDSKSFLEIKRIIK